MFTNFVQAWLMITSLTSVLLIGSRQARPRMWGFAIGLCGQPAWIISGYLAGQWGLLVLSVVYTGLQVRGIYNNRRANG